MKPFVLDPSPISSYQSIAREKNVYVLPKYNGEFNISCSENPVYELYAVSNHYGGLGGGHYTAFAKNGESWYDFNDSSVRPIDSKDIQGNSAYILFYRRKD
jgi:ubiquitin C-terminal hydrolase